MADQMLRLSGDASPEQQAAVTAGKKLLYFLLSSFYFRFHLEYNTIKSLYNSCILTLDGKSGLSFCIQLVQLEIRYLYSGKVYNF